MLLVDIILPTYNRSQFLEKCIVSILTQTYHKWNLLIVDDCSSDDTMSVSRQFCWKDIRIKYYRSESNQGLPANRNLGISYSTGDIVFFIEDDMLLDKDCLYTLVNTFNMLKSKNIKVGAVAPSILNVFKGNPGLGILNLKARLLHKPCHVSPYTGVVYFDFSPRYDEIQEVPNAHACCFYNSEVFRSINYDYARYGGNYLFEDTDFNHRIVKSGYNIYFQPKAIMNHVHISSGGCRTSIFKYGYYFSRNYIKYVLKNYGIKSVYMIPLFYLYIFGIAFIHSYKVLTGKAQ